MGDFLKYDWSEGSIFFANSTCYDGVVLLIYNS